MIGTIYMVLNTVNNKKYIGQTIMTLNRRKSSHLLSAKHHGEQARQNKAKTSKWFVKVISPEKEELIFISSKEPNQYFGRDISLRSRMKNVGDKWIPTKRSPLYGWQFEAIEKYEF